MVPSTPSQGLACLFPHWDSFKAPGMSTGLQTMQDPVAPSIVATSSHQDHTSLDEKGKSTGHCHSSSAQVPFSCEPHRLPQFKPSCSLSAHPSFCEPSKSQGHWRAAAEELGPGRSKFIAYQPAEPDICSHCGTHNAMWGPPHAKPSHRPPVEASPQLS